MSVEPQVQGSGLTTVDILVTPGPVSPCHGLVSGRADNSLMDSGLVDMYVSLLRGAKAYLTRMSQLAGPGVTVPFGPGRTLNPTILDACARQTSHSFG